MKLIAHYIFTIGLLVFIVRAFTSGAGYLYIAVFSGFLVNFIIDKIGHEAHNGHPRRTFITHSIYTAPVWGAVVTALPVVVGAYALGEQGYIQPISFSIPFLVLLGVVAGYSHLLLDAVTEAGIYTKPHHRVAIAHIPYNSVVGNGFAILVGLALAGITFQNAYFLLHFI